MRDIALRVGQVYHIESLPVIQHDIYIKLWLPTIGAPRETEVAHKGTLFSKELRASTNNLLLQR